MPAVPQVTAWVALAVIFSGKASCCFLNPPFFPRPGLAFSICVQHLPSSYPCKWSSRAVPHHCFMLETQRSSSSFLCLKCTAVYGRLRRISFFKKQDVALIRFILLVSSPSPDNLQRSLSLLGKLFNPHSLHAPRLSAVCVMASHSWRALCSLAIDNALNTEFPLTFILLFP